MSRDSDAAPRRCFCDGDCRRGLGTSPTCLECSSASAPHTGGSRAEDHATDDLVSNGRPLHDRHNPLHPSRRRPSAWRHGRPIPSCRCVVAGKTVQAIVRFREATGDDEFGSGLQRGQRNRLGAGSRGRPIREVVGFTMPLAPQNNALELAVSSISSPARSSTQCSTLLVGISRWIAMEERPAFG